MPSLHGGCGHLPHECMNGRGSCSCVLVQKFPRCIGEDAHMAVVVSTELIQVIVALRLEINHSC